MAYNEVYIPKANEPATPAVVEATPAEKPATSVEQTPQDKPDDLLSRVAQFETEAKPAGKPDDDIDAEVFRDKELRAKIDSIQDPTIRDQFIAMRKSMITGLNHKFEDVATLRKELEAFKQSSRPRFAANSIEELLQNKEFVTEAQRLTGQADQLSQDDTLSQEAKAEILKVKSELEAIKQKQAQELAMQQQANWNKQHTELSVKYKNYDSVAVDRLANDLINNKVNVTPEALYKVLYHDDNMKRAYELGRREAMQSISERRDVTVTNGINPTTTVQNGSLTQEQNEDNKTFLQRIINSRLAGKK